MHRALSALVPPIIIGALLLVSGCDEDECRKYSKFTCKELVRQTYAVWFSFPNGDKTYNLGQVQGLRQCQVTAAQFASSKNLSQNREWSYICCIVTDDFNCLEKHR